VLYLSNTLVMFHNILLIAGDRAHFHSWSIRDWPLDALLIFKNRLSNCSQFFFVWNLTLAAVRETSRRERRASHVIPHVAPDAGQSEITLNACSAELVRTANGPHPIRVSRRLCCSNEGATLTSAFFKLRLPELGAYHIYTAQYEANIRTHGPILLAYLPDLLCYSTCIDKAWLIH